MKNRTRGHIGALAAVLALTSALSGCNWFYHSNFPGYVPLIQKQVDISDRFPYDPSAEFRVEVMNGGTGDYVIILAEGPVMGKRLAIYDESLKEGFYRKATPSADQFNRSSPVVIDDTPNLYVGNLAFGPGLSGPTDLSDNLMFSEGAFYDIPTSTYRSFRLSGSDLIYKDQVDIEIDIIDTNLMYDSAMSNYALLSVTSDLQAGVVGIVAFSSDLSLVAGVVDSFSTFTLLDPVENSNGAFGFTIEYSFVQRLSVTADGVVIEEDDNERGLVFYDLDGNKGDRLNIRSRGDTAYAFSAAGTHFYLLRAEEGKLIKADTWW